MDDRVAQFVEAWGRVKQTLDSLDKAQRVEAHHLMLTIGPSNVYPVRAGETCPFCGHTRRKLPAEQHVKEPTNG